jgi:predicted metalloprotease with PDZ domain
MIDYTLRCHRSAEQLIEVSLQTEVEAGMIRWFLPHWRPGRYEMQNYAKLVSDVVASDAQGQPLPLTKCSTQGWQVEVPSATRLTLRYVFYANQPDAGGSFLDATQLMVNGINLFMFPEGGEELPCRLWLDLPAGFQLSGGLAQVEDHYVFESFHQLVDSPFLAGTALQHHSFEASGLPIHLWFLGDCRPDFPQLERDIRAYSEAQLAFFGTCPVKDYHYLYLMLPQRFRHGVEHHRSTVIVMGPGRDLRLPEMHRSLLEISSHEFFHTWNVKALRPAEMWPYDYHQENYSQLHYITEGVTTYYGDLMLWKAGLWDVGQWLGSINGELMRHYQMGGKDYVSLSEASFDSWVNGYHQEGLPNRRISFYTKGYLVAMLLDLDLRRTTGHAASLDTVMQQLYRQVTAQGRGYTRQEVKDLIEAQAGTNYDAFFAAYVDGIDDLTPALRALGDFYGMSLLHLSSQSPSEAHWGLKTSATPQGTLLVETLYPGSPLLAAGLAKGDELMAVAGRQLRNDLDPWLQDLAQEERVSLHYFHQGRLQVAEVPLRGSYRRDTPQFVINAQASAEQLANRLRWQQIGQLMEPAEK